MFQNLNMFKTAMSMARHAGLKQAVTSQNIANSDTPGYRARVIPEFTSLVPRDNHTFSLKTTHGSHFNVAGEVSATQESLRTKSEPNGNGVDLDTEILNSVNAKRQHDRALAVYRASLGMLRSTLSKQ